nr:hypothetical protein B296_00053983 [Ipomoea batatas]
METRPTQDQIFELCCNLDAYPMLGTTGENIKDMEIQPDGGERLVEVLSFGAEIFAPRDCPEQRRLPFRHQLLQRRNLDPRRRAVQVRHGNAVPAPVHHRAVEDAVVQPVGEDVEEVAGVYDERAGDGRHEEVEVLRPKKAGMFERGADDGEAFRPHKFGEERRNPGDAVAGDAVGRAGGPHLLVQREREQPFSGGLHPPQQLPGNAVIDHLKRTPRLACTPYLLRRAFQPQELERAEAVYVKEMIVLSFDEGTRKGRG